MSIFEIASKISKPLQITGFALAALFFIYKQVLSKDKENKQGKAIVNKLFVLSLVAMCLGFLGWIYVESKADSTIHIYGRVVDSVGVGVRGVEVTTNPRGGSDESDGKGVFELSFSNNADHDSITLVFDHAGCQRRIRLALPDGRLEMQLPDETFQCATQKDDSPKKVPPAPPSPNTDDDGGGSVGSGSLDTQPPPELNTIVLGGKVKDEDGNGLDEVEVSSSVYGTRILTTNGGDFNLKILTLDSPLVVTLTFRKTGFGTKDNVYAAGIKKMTILRQSN